MKIGWSNMKSFSSVTYWSMWGNLKIPTFLSKWANEWSVSKYIRFSEKPVNAWINWLRVIKEPFFTYFSSKIELFSVSANIRRFWEKRIVLLLQFVKRLHVAMANNHSKKRKPSLRNNHYLFKQWETPW